MAGLAIGSGCGPQGGQVERPGPAFSEFEPMSAVIGRVNQNAAAADFLLKGGGLTATGEFERGDHLESFELHGALLFSRPKNLYLKLEHVGGTIEAGSNEQEFWFWERLQVPRYTWGRHDSAGLDLEADIPLRPDLLAEVLGLGDLPSDTKGPNGPAFWVGTDFYELVFLDRDSTGQVYVTKTIDIDRFEPFLVRSLVYFSPDGRPIIQAKLDEYQPVTGSSVLAPRKIRIDWLYDRSWVELAFATMQRFDSPAGEKRFRSPREQGLDLGEERRIDHPAPASHEAPSSGVSREP
jgi:hypothetical protein